MAVLWMDRWGHPGDPTEWARVACMAIVWAVEVLAVGQENARVVGCGVAGTEQAAQAAATAALVAGVGELGRRECWINVGTAVMMLVSGLDLAGKIDITDLRGALYFAR